MKPIEGKVFSYTSRSKKLDRFTVEEVRRDKGRLVISYSELLELLARLFYSNPEYLILLRGQEREHNESSRSTLYPSMYRSSSTCDHYYAYELKSRYETLRESEEQLYELFKVEKYEHYRERVGRSELARWAILQHYGICPTPLLDVTHSSLVACSFALLEKRNKSGDECILYALGFPQINGSITVSHSNELQIVRLSSLCPPEALRPYFQEGYLVGTYPSIDTLDQKMRYKRTEMDCASRVIAKFRLKVSDSFWGAGFDCLEHEALYPIENNDLIVKIRNLRRA